jgi:hypothetical protein
MRRVPILLCLVAAAGCLGTAGEFTLAPTDPDVTGTFSLASSNGEIPPFVVSQTPDQQVALTADQFVMSADSTWSETTTYDVLSLATLTDSALTTKSSGSYTVANKTITFQMIVGGNLAFTGSVTGSTLNVLYNGSHFVYAR